MGFTAGGLGRLSVAGRHALRLILEGRAFQNNYVPSYFDSFYEVQRFQYITRAAAPKTDLPKLADVLGRDRTQTNLGYYAELQYASVDTLAVTAAFEDSTAKGGRNLVLHAEMPANEWLRFFASFHRRAVEGSLFDLGKPAARRSARGRQHALLRGGAPQAAADPLPQRARLPRVADGPAAAELPERGRLLRRPRGRVRVLPHVAHPGGRALATL